MILSNYNSGEVGAGGYTGGMPTGSSVGETPIGGFAGDTPIGGGFAGDTDHPNFSGDTDHGSFIGDTPIVGFAAGDMPGGRFYGRRFQMRRIIALTIVIAFLAGSLAAQETQPREIYSRSGKLIAIYGLLPKTNCGMTRIVGVIKKVSKDPEYDGIDFEIYNQKRYEYAGMNYGQMSNAGRSWLDRLIKKGNRVDVRAYTCGSSGVLDVISVRLVQ